jgi:hypothetical protein
MIPQDDAQLRCTCALPERGEAEKGQDNVTAKQLLIRTEVAVSRLRLYLSTCAWATLELHLHLHHLHRILVKMWVFELFWCTPIRVRVEDAGVRVEDTRMRVDGAGVRVEGARARVEEYDE